MTPERWSRIKELFQAALDRPPDARAGYLDEACAGDDDARREVASLLGAHEEAGTFLETPVLADQAGAGPALRAGMQLGPYRIGAVIGSGGMGEVYRARDDRLGRDVAIKVLPAAMAGDAARVKRFEQEARAASALNHPHIVAVYDTGRHGGAPYLVTELLEGETLAGRLARAPMPLRKALECALQVASGLVAAHGRGIVHRDLKPANLFLTEQGQIKILDFGVAKLAQAAGGAGESGAGESGAAESGAGESGAAETGAAERETSESPSRNGSGAGAGSGSGSGSGSPTGWLAGPATASPTAPSAEAARSTAPAAPANPATASPATAPGLIVGTVGYMAPEQVRAGRVDFRADQFGLGCVLYQLLTGAPPFARASAAETIAALLDDEPPALAEVNPRVPRPIAWIVERCLAKDPDDRYASTRDLARDLELALGRLAELTARVVAPPPRPARRAWRALAIAAAFAAGGAVVWGLTRRDPPAPPATSVPALRYLTYSGRDSSPAASPDGTTIAFSSRRDGHRRIWLAQVVSGSEAPLTGGEDDHPRFSPDGSAILFARIEAGRTSLYRVPVVGGEPRKLVDDALYGDFSPDGRRVAFVRQVPDTAGAGATTLVMTAATDGSNVRQLARLDGSRFPTGAFVGPRWSPDGRWLAATQSTLQLGEPTVIGILDAATGQMRRLTQPGPAGAWRGALAWVGPDQIAYAEPESVVGQQTGTSSRVVLWNLTTGQVRPLLSTPVNLVRLDVLGRGRLILEARQLRQNLREIPLAGPTEPATPTAPTAPAERWLSRGNAADRQPTYAPSGEWLAFSSNRSGNLDIWALSRTTGAVRRLTDHGAQDSDPGFMPDGRLLWSSNRSGKFEVWIAAPDGSGARQLTHDGVDAENPVATPDGRWILYASASPRTRGIMKIRPDGSGAARVVPGNAIEPEVSPDGQYVAYVADQGTAPAALRVARIAGGAPVFAIALPPWVSGDGVDQGRCRWLPGGRALAYVARDAGSYAVFTQDFAPGQDTTGSRRRLAWLGPELAAESLAVSPDGANLTVSFREQVHDLMLADGVAGVDRPR